jgi:hypothetical protein
LLTNDSVLFSVRFSTYPKDAGDCRALQFFEVPLMQNPALSPNRPSQSRPLLAYLAAAILVASVPTHAEAQPCPPGDQLQPVVTAPEAIVVPDDVCIPRTTHGLPLAYFDDLSWREFIALVWPAKGGAAGRGSADPELALGKAYDNLPTVFETYKADWETFVDPPSPWKSYDAKLPCPNARQGDFFLSAISKSGDAADVRTAALESVTSVLVSQNGRFVRYLPAYNEKEFDAILKHGWYLQKNVKDVTFPEGSISVKSSWVEMINMAHPERFHTRQAWLVDPFSGPCKQITVGLVGLHIVHKTPTRHNWVWSTFEHVDNVPPPGYVPPYGTQKPDATFTFNNGTATRMPQKLPRNYTYRSVLSSNGPPAPINIERLNPINSDYDVPFRSTIETNLMWRRALKAQKSVWQYYQLVMTQWPIDDLKDSDPGTPGYTIPGGGAGDIHSAFANATLETWPQTDVKFGCMNCHTKTKKGSDFVWSLVVKSLSDRTALPLRDLPSVIDLRRFLGGL